MGEVHLKFRSKFVDGGEGAAWRLETRDLNGIRRFLGEPVATSLCRCLVAVDRLTSIAHLDKVNTDHVEGETPIASRRNRLALFMFSCGTLRELARALEALRVAGIAGRLRGDSLIAWNKLDECRKRWEGHRLFREARDKMAFHFDDSGVLGRGLDSLGALELVVFAQGDSKKSLATRFQLGEEALMRGMWPDLDEAGWKKFMEQVAEDHAVVFVELQTLLYDLVAGSWGAPR